MRLDRRAFIAGAIALSAAPLAAKAQPARKVWRIGFLSFGSAPAPATPDPADAFWQRLRELGYVEGVNVVVDHRFAERKLERLPEFAAELVWLNPDVIVTRASPAAAAAKKATPTIPIVMASSLDPVREGIVASLARPGGNVTGMMFASDADIIGKRLQLLKEAIPSLSRLAIVAGTPRPFSDAVIIWLRDTEAAAKALGVHVQIVDVQDPSNWEDACATMVATRADALYVIESPSYIFHAKHIAGVALKKRMPTMFGAREHVEAGGLMSYGLNLPAVFRRAADFVDKVLRGAKPADLPVEQPTKYELVINRKTAKALGLTIPPLLLQRAEMIE